MSTPLYVLYGAERCRSYHITVDQHAADLVAQQGSGACSDDTGLTFRTLCRKDVQNTLVSPLDVEIVGARRMDDYAAHMCNHCARTANRLP